MNALERLQLITLVAAQLEEPTPPKIGSEGEIRTEVFDGEPCNFSRCGAVVAGETTSPEPILRGTGILIGNRRVLTAAHVIGPWPLYFAITDDLNQVTTVDATVKAQGQRLPLGYQLEGPRDFAVLYLEREVDIPPVRLATPQEFLTATEVQIIGFGLDERSRSGLKLCATLPIVYREGMLNNGTWQGVDPAIEFAAGRDGAGACDNDSGGPALIRVGEDWKLAGVTKGTLGGCGQSHTVFTRVDVFAECIERAFTEDECPWLTRP
jgi:hypothetical protein